MRRFRFRFEKLLRVRLLREEEAKAELAKELAELARLEEERARLEAGLLELHDLMRAQTSGGFFDPGYFVSLRRAAQGMRARIERAGEGIAKQNGEVERAKGKVAERMRERTVLDKVRETDLAAWRKEREGQENLLLDEIGGRTGRDER